MDDESRAAAERLGVHIRLLEFEQTSNETLCTLSRQEFEARNNLLQNFHKLFNDLRKMNEWRRVLPIVISDVLIDSVEAFDRFLIDLKKHVALTIVNCKHHEERAEHIQAELDKCRRKLALLNGTSTND